MTIRERAHDRAQYIADVMDITDSERDMIEESIVQALMTLQADLMIEVREELQEIIFNTTRRIG